MRRQLMLVVLALLPTLLFGQTQLGSHPDVLPNPFSPEGIKLQKEWTRRMLIPIDGTTKMIVDNIGRNFLQSITTGDKSLMRKLTLGDDNAVLKGFDKYVSDSHKSNPRVQ